MIEPEESATRRRLTVTELARRLEIPVLAAYRGLRAGEIPSKRIGRRYVIFADVVEDWRKRSQPESTT